MDVNGYEVKLEGVTIEMDKDYSGEIDEIFLVPEGTIMDMLGHFVGLTEEKIVGHPVVS